MVSTPPCHGGRGVRVPRSRLNVVKITLLKEDLQQIKTTEKIVNSLEEFVLEGGASTYNCWVSH